MTNYRPMVKTGADPTFYGNNSVFATREEAESSAIELAGRWTMVSGTGVEETDKPVNRRFINGENKMIPRGEL